MADIQLVWDNCKTYNLPDSVRVFPREIIGYLRIGRAHGAADAKNRGKAQNWR